MNKESGMAVLLLLLCSIGGSIGDGTNMKQDGHNDSLLKSGPRVWNSDYFINKIVAYMSSYASSNIYNWLSYPWFGIQAGAVFLIVLLTVIYIMLWRTYDIILILPIIYQSLFHFIKW